ncbi:peptidyl-prolyl cis-trans isomerase CYP21-4-like [Primulina tabacum]|uniref:peptidyl-prolyl cis-trans isomerase CYP21-4-like n=1 Tax=Primulina tabacum TaxID=48773 RepID=UPI003F595307
MGKIKPQALLMQSKKKKAPSRISVVTIGVYFLIVVVTVFFLFSAYRHWTRRSKVSSEELVSSLEHDRSFSKSKKLDTPKYAVINTSKGLITVELYKDGSPEVVDKFINSWYVPHDCFQWGHFRGMLFNRVIKNFFIQGGDVSRPGTTEDWTSRGKHYNHLDTSMKHEAFMLGTSKTKQGGGKFDLFITTAPIPDLTEKINVFGRVIKGEDVVQEIEEADTDEHYRPKTPIGIIEVTMKETA